MSKGISVIDKALFLLLFVFISSCTTEPQTKEDYLNEYHKFINDIGKKKGEFTKQDWESIERKHKKFTGETFENFKNSMSWKEKLELTKYEFQYNLKKFKNNSGDFFDEYLKDDTAKLKKQLKYYTENEMQEDIDYILQQAKEVGSTAVETIGDLLEELKVELEEKEKKN